MYIFQSIEHFDRHFSTAVGLQGIWQLQLVRGHDILVAQNQPLANRGNLAISLRYHVCCKHNPLPPAKRAKCDKKKIDLISNGWQGRD